MSKTSQDKSIRDKAVEAALALAAEKAWGDVSFEDIIEKAELALDDSYEYFDDKSDILAAYGRKIDREMLANITIDETLSHRETIFDIVMERLDIVNEQRPAIVSILNSFKSDPKQAFMVLPHLARSMSRILEAADISTSGIGGCVRVTGLTGLYLYVLRTWREDDSADMAKTMGTLDKALDKAEILYNSLPISS